MAKAPKMPPKMAKMIKADTARDQKKGVKEGSGKDMALDAKAKKMAGIKGRMPPF